MLVDAMDRLWLDLLETARAYEDGDSVGEPLWRQEQTSTHN